MSNSQYSANSVDSLISYINDVKPFHCKLSEIVEEYQFFDNVNVAIDDKWHFTKTKIAGIWDNNNFSNGLVAPIFDLPFFKYSKSSSNWNSQSNKIDYSKSYTKVPGLSKAFYVGHNNGVRKVSKNDSVLIEGIDFHISKGAVTYSVNGQDKVFYTTDLANDVVTDGDKQDTSLSYSEYVHYDYDEFGKYDKQFKVSNIEVDSNRIDYEEFTLECVSANGASASFMLKGSSTGIIGYAGTAIGFSSSLINFSFSDINPNYSFKVGQSFCLTPSNDITTHKDYLANEKWTLIKVNPIAYDNPIFKKVNAPIISDFIVKNSDIISQTLKLTFSGLSFIIESSIDGVLGTITPGAVFENSDFYFLIAQGSIPPSDGDYFEIDIQNKGVQFLDLNFTLGFDPAITPNAEGSYDVGVFDASTKSINLLDMNLSAVPNGNYMSGFYEVFFNGADFSITKYVSAQDKTILKSTEHALPGETFQNDELSFTIPNNSYIFGEMFYFTIKNNPITIDDSQKLLISRRLGKITLYPKSFINSPEQVWKIKIETPNTFSVVGSLNPNSSTIGEISKSFDNGFIHFSLFNDTNIPFIQGDEFTINVKKDKPSFLVLNENTGFHEPVTVGQWYWNGKIGLKIKNPSITIKQFTPDIVNPTEENGLPIYPKHKWDSLELTSFPCEVKLDSRGRRIVFNSAPRFDLFSDVYKCELVSTSNRFKQTSSTQFFNITSAFFGIRKSAIVNERYFEDGYSGLSIHNSENHNDGILDFTIYNYPSNGSAVPFEEFDRFKSFEKEKAEYLTFNYDSDLEGFDVQSFDQNRDRPNPDDYIGGTANVVYQNDLALFNKKLNRFNEYCVKLKQFFDNNIDKARFDFKKNKNAPKLYYAQDIIIFRNEYDEIIDKLYVEKEVSDKIKIKTSKLFPELGVNPLNDIDQWIPIYLEPIDNFSDEAESIDVFSSILHEKIGTITSQPNQSSKYQLNFEDSFFKKYFPLNTRISTKVIQTEQENSLVKPRFTEKLKFKEKINFNDSFIVSFKDSGADLVINENQVSKFVFADSFGVYFDDINSSIPIQLAESGLALWLPAVLTDLTDPPIQQDLEYADRFLGLPDSTDNWKNLDVLDQFDWDGTAIKGIRVRANLNLPLLSDWNNAQVYEIDSMISPPTDWVFGSEIQNQPSFDADGWKNLDDIPLQEANTALPSFNEVMTMYNLNVGGIEWLDAYAEDALPPFDAEGWNNADVTDGLPLQDPDGWDNALFDIVYGYSNNVSQDNIYELTASISKLKIPSFGSTLASSQYALVPCAEIKVTRMIDSATIMKIGLTTATNIVAYTDSTYQIIVPINILVNNANSFEISLPTPATCVLVIF